MTRNYWQAFFLIAILEFSVFLAGFWMLGDYEAKRFNVWPISEWLINYQGGFVRRGLMGEILRYFSDARGSIVLLNSLVLTFFYLYIVIFLAVYYFANIRQIGLLIIALLIPGGVLHMSIGAIFYPRKEILFLIHFGILCLIYLMHDRFRVKEEGLSLDLFGITAVLGGGLLTLVHEAYLFMAYPITVLLFVILHKANRTYYPLKLQLFFYVLLIPVLFGVCSAYRGDPQIAQRIWDSYTLIDRLVLAPAAPYTAAYATAGLGWTLQQHLSTIYGVFMTGTWIYWLFFAIANAFVLVYIAIQIEKKQVIEQGNSESNYFKNSLLPLQTIGAFVISSSMVMIASDYGRWIACATNLTLLFLFTVSHSSGPQNLDWGRWKLGNRLIPIFNWMGGSTVALILILSYELIFQMPECCISGVDLFMPYAKFLELYHSN